MVWRAGFNYVPSTAVNAIEQWRAPTHDEATARRELGWAAALGYRACRVFVPFACWAEDAAGLATRFDRFLALAAGLGIAAMPVLFDDCAFDAAAEPVAGPQPDPRPGVHNGRWMPSPGPRLAREPDTHPALRAYVEDLVGRHARDPRVVAWDLYNEPGNGGMGAASLPLVERAFAWARASRPTQPLTMGVWRDDDAFRALNDAQVRLSDVVSFHCYDPLDRFAARVAALPADRPVVCTEWFARTFDQSFATLLPWLRRRGIDAYQWGLVRGRTQTHLPWGWTADRGEPPVWFHDLLREDGTPYDPREIGTLRAALAGDAAAVA